MDGYQDDEKDTENATDATDESEPDTPDETDSVEESAAEPETQVDEAVESMTSFMDTPMLEITRLLASGEITREAGRAWLAKNHPD